jgi:hypothetical protein
VQVNKEGADWKLVKAELNTRIAQLQDQMLSSLSVEEYHRCRGSILLAKDLIEWVEPTTPGKTSEDDYGISDANRENYT